MTVISNALADFKLLATPIGAELDSADPETWAEADDWLPAVVPGGVHESLLAAGTIEDPYYDRNEASVRWIEERDWWFRSSFEGPADLTAGERLRLIFHGLDTVVDIFLNGELLGSHENMFRPAIYDVTTKLQPKNTLLLRFSPPLHGLEIPNAVISEMTRFAELSAAMAGTEAPEEGAEMANPFSEMLPLSTLRRKAAFSWGWDFGPRIPSIGIWRPVELVREQHAVITSHFVSTEQVDAEARTAKLRLSVEADVLDSSGPLAAQITLVSPSGQDTSVKFELAALNDRAVGSIELTLKDVDLWWTHDLGTPSLYQVQVTLSENDVELHRVDDRIGIRSITLDRQPDTEGGNLFRFILNGTPIFARGGAWLPASMLVGSVTPERYRELVQRAHDGNMNMLRVWGGGVYEHDAFYTACDELGLLVWQDFMFACIDYPSADPHLQAEVALEAEYQVRRLRNRACIALWCGNNEVQALHGAAYQNYEPGDWGYDFFFRILPEAVEKFGGTVEYWPGSPWGVAEAEGFMAANGVLDGDRHAWEVWHGINLGPEKKDFPTLGDARHFRRYADDSGKFISEFGIHASPELSTLQRWIPAEQLSVHSPSFDEHNKDHPKDKGDAMLEVITGLPQGIEQYVDFTMAVQAEGLKFGIEHYRRRQPHCSGTLIWQFNDVWPGFSWSILDYDAVPKAGYYFTKRVYAPVIASFRDDQNGTFELWITNSGPETVTTEAIVSLENFDGSVDSQQTISVTVHPGESSSVWSIDAATIPSTTNRYLRVESPDSAFPVNRKFLAEIKDLEFGPSTLETKIERTGPHSATIELTSRGYSYLARVLSPAPGARFDDNYVDLRDGEVIRIHLDGLNEDFDVSGLVVASYPGSPAATTAS
ncbi:glycoside hydrolase family 2 protein [Psychromicrobium sp. YIM B11713]|uniref:beta-mannosidase n=1 Tax=Psychromicrobium sp. YIM B11713 TaxID=3145233 RepID=UPI00374E7587